MDMGFERAGFEIVWTNEVEGSFIKFYKDGMTSWKNARGIEGEVKISNENSIKTITSEKILEQVFSEYGIPDIFGIIGGPPCQDFSSRGSLQGFGGEKGPLTDDYLYKILEIQPTFFVMENVTGLLRHSHNANHFLSLLELVGEEYHTDILRLNSLHFGVPQFRERIFVVGIAKSHLEDVEFPDSNENWFPYPYNPYYHNAENKFPWPIAISFTGNKELVKPEAIPLELCVESCLISMDNEDKIPNSKEWFNLLGDKRKFKGIKEGETNRPSFKRLHRYKFSPTSCYGNNEVHLHPYKHRRISVREALRIQGVEDSYVLGEGSLTKKFKMIGNGVPVPMAEAIASTMASFLDNYKTTQIWTSGQERNVVLL